MSALGGLRTLTREACSSYMIYLSCTGVLNTHNAKLYLLKWPDVTITAITLAENPSKQSIKSLEKDLSVLVFEPIRIIYESALERLRGFTNKNPPGIISNAKKAEQVYPEDPIKAKKILIGCINRIFEVLKTLTNNQYPEIK